MEQETKAQLLGYSTNVPLSGLTPGNQYKHRGHNSYYPKWRNPLYLAH